MEGVVVKKVWFGADGWVESDKGAQGQDNGSNPMAYNRVLDTRPPPVRRRHYRRGQAGECVVSHFNGVPYDPKQRQWESGIADVVAGPLNIEVQTTYRGEKILLRPVTRTWCSRWLAVVHFPLPLGTPQDVEYLGMAKVIDVRRWVASHPDESTPTQETFPTLRVVGMAGVERDEDLSWIPVSDFQRLASWHNGGGEVGIQPESDSMLSASSPLCGEIAVTHMSQGVLF